MKHNLVPLKSSIYWFQSLNENFCHVEWPCGDKWNSLRTFLWLCKLGLAYVRHFVLVASLDNSIDNGFSGHLGTIKIPSWSRSNFFVVDVEVVKHVSNIPLVPTTFRSFRITKLAAFINYIQLWYFLQRFWVP